MEFLASFAWNPGWNVLGDATYLHNQRSANPCVHSHCSIEGVPALHLGLFNRMCGVAALARFRGPLLVVSASWLDE